MGFRVYSSLALAMLAGAPWRAALAQPPNCAATLTAVSGRAADVRVEPGGRGIGGAPVALNAFDRVVIESGATTATIERVSGPDRALTVVTAAAPFTVLPCAAGRPDASRRWNAFWSDLNRPEPTRGSDGRVLSRGVHRPDPVLTGPLRELANLGGAQGMVPGTRGLALAWAGGKPPFTVTAEDEQSRTVLARSRSVEPRLWLPDWRNPAKPLVITIRDSEGAELTRRMTPLPAAPEGDLVDEVVLFQDRPEYRLEALRRLTERALDGDKVADQACRTVSSAGARR